MATRQRKLRVAHRINENKGSSIPKYVIFFDTETKDKDIGNSTKELTLKLGYAILARYYKGRGYIKQSDCVFYNRRTFNAWISKVCVGKERYIMTAHNIGFDVRITAIMKYLSRQGWNRKSFILDEHNFMASFRKDNTSVFLTDNMQIFNSSLKSLGESLGIPKLKIDFDNTDNDSLLVYCKRDVEIMQLAWTKWATFIQTYDLGNFKSTIGSQAFTAFRHRFMDTDIFIHTNQKAVDLERESYHGGRVECFYIGQYSDSKVYCLDVNSMYPYIMKTVKLPYILTAYYDKLTLKDFYRIHNTVGYICSATVKIDRPTLPTVFNNRLVFPTGEVTGVWTKPELEAALKTGTLVSVSRCAVYSEALLFKEYVDFFYTQRLRFKKEGNAQFSYFAKLLMNSLYGKFGQRLTEFSVAGYNPKLPDQGGTTYDLFTKLQVKYRVIDGIIEKETGTYEGNDTFVAIASYITGAARAYLLSLIEIAGWDNVLYCDTDSLFLNHKGRVNLRGFIDDSVIGKLKVEGVSDSIIISGSKRYVFGAKVANKGIRKAATKIGVNKYSQVQFQSFRAAVNTGHTDSVIIKQIVKTLKDDYVKGTVTPSGRVTPLVFPPESF